MKVDGLTIYQAAKAVSLGRAEGMRRQRWYPDGLIKFVNDYMRWEHTKTEVDLLQIQDLTATDWELINPRPRTETVEVKRWELVNDNGYTIERFDTGAGALEWQKKRADSHVVELTGAYQRPLPDEPEVWEGRVTLQDGNHLRISLDKYDGKLECKRVRVEVVE